MAKDIEKLANTNVEVKQTDEIKKLSENKYKTITKAITDDECSALCKGIGTVTLLEEIERREKTSDYILKQINDVMVTTYNKELDLVQKRELIKKLKMILREGKEDENI